MKKLLLSVIALAAATIGLAACTDDIPTVPLPTVTVPVVVPSVSTSVSPSPSRSVSASPVVSVSVSPSASPSVSSSADVLDLNRRHMCRHDDADCGDIPGDGK